MYTIETIQTVFQHQISPVVNLSLAARWPDWTLILADQPTIQLRFSSGPLSDSDSVGWLQGDGKSLSLQVVYVPPSPLLPPPPSSLPPPPPSSLGRERGGGRRSHPQRPDRSHAAADTDLISDSSFVSY